MSRGSKTGTERPSNHLLPGYASDVVRQNKFEGLFRRLMDLDRLAIPGRRNDKRFII